MLTDKLVADRLLASLDVVGELAEVKTLLKVTLAEVVGEKMLDAAADTVVLSAN